MRKKIKIQWWGFESKHNHSKYYLSSNTNFLQQFKLLKSFSYVMDHNLTWTVFPLLAQKIINNNEVIKQFCWLLILVIVSSEEYNLFSSNASTHKEKNFLSRNEEIIDTVRKNCILFAVTHVVSREENNSSEEQKYNLFLIFSFYIMKCTKW